MGTALAIVIILITAVLCIFLIYHLIRLRFEGSFRHWREIEEQKWEAAKEGIRKEAITQSRAVLGGKFVEQLAPYLPEFNYDPTEARFIGSPIDLLIFPGLASGVPREIVIMEIKTSRIVQLTPQESRIRQLIEDGMVRWELLHLPAQPELSPGS